MHTYRRTKNKWEVYFYFNAKSIHSFEHEVDAAKFVHYLNGGGLSDRDLDKMLLVDDSNASQVPLESG
jgi:hypothetical protein